MSLAKQCELLSADLDLTGKTKATELPSDSTGTRGDALPVHTGATGNSSAADAKGTSDSASGNSSAKAKMEEGVAKTRTGEEAVGRRGGTSMSG